MLERVINISTGEVKAAGANSILTSAAIGSCIVVAAFYPRRPAGAMAHIMLPGKSSKKNEEIKLRYAYDAINELLSRLNIPEKNYQDISICLVGAGNVLKKKDDSICRDNITSVHNILSRKNLSIKATALGGYNRRSVRMDVSSGEVYFTENGSKEMLLWPAKPDEQILKGYKNEQ